MKTVQFFILRVSKRTTMFVLKMKRKAFLIQSKNRSIQFGWFKKLTVEAQGIKQN